MSLNISYHSAALSSTEIGGIIAVVTCIVLVLICVTTTVAVLVCSKRRSSGEWRNKLHGYGHLHYIKPGVI